jgi:hypothetical protein
MFEFLSKTGFKKYQKQARKILDGNWTGSYTKPSPKLYPHQWSWDSAFIAIGYAHYDTRRAMQELTTLFANQWDNGMVPQIVFNTEALGNYFPEPDFWQVPDNRPTSGITMPPLHAVAAWRVHKFSDRNKTEARDFLKEIFPKLMAAHRYLYKYRDMDGSGLVYIRHPWESGLDNSPSWDQTLDSIEIDKSALPSYQRRDLGHGVPAEQRPTDDHYDRYVYLVDLFRRLSYSESTIQQECPFMIQDVLFNSILCRANHHLIDIGSEIGADVGEAKEWLEQTKSAIKERLWSPERSQFDPYDLRGKRLLPTSTAASFMPLFAVAASQDQAEALYEKADSVSFCGLHQGNCFTIPNYDMSREDFDPQNYWRGPVWININWMLSQGMKSYGFQEKADSMKKDMIQLPVRFGFHEYFDSISGSGYGSKDFSWTAALFMDLVNEYYERDKSAFDWIGLGKGRSLSSLVVLNQGGEGNLHPMPDLASKLMASIGGLKETFYDMRRGLVDYEAMRGSTQYKEYCKLAEHLRAFDLTWLTSREEKLAFWINLYNTIVVHGIVALGIKSSVREITNFFTHITYQIGHENFSPDDMEHGILRSNARPPYRIFKAFRSSDPRADFALEKLDPRIHFALVCGSRSCAPIRFYDSKNIDEQLDTACSNFVNSSEVVILPEVEKMLLSQIFKWYSRDFGGRPKVFDFLLKYLDLDDKAEYLSQHRYHMNVEYLFYDWNLNH